MRISFTFSFEMKHFLRHSFFLFTAICAAFLGLAALSTQSSAINWFFFQAKDDFNTDSHTMVGIEQALADSSKGGLLIVGSSVCKNSINPTLLGALTDTKVHQLCTGGQSVQGALALAKFLYPRLKPDAILLDLYPRVAEEQVTEGCMRIMLGHPDGRTELARFNALSITEDWPLRYLWAKSWVAGFFNTSMPESADRTPGFLCAENKPPMLATHERRTVEVDPVALHEMRKWKKDHPDVQLIVNLPPLHGGSFEPLRGEPFLALEPKVIADSCFFDSHHMRCECTDQYTRDLATSLEPHLN